MYLHKVLGTSAVYACEYLCDVGEARWTLHDMSGASSTVSVNLLTSKLGAIGLVQHDTIPLEVNPEQITLLETSLLHKHAPDGPSLNLR